MHLDSLSYDHCSGRPPCTFHSVFHRNWALRLPVKQQNLLYISFILLAFRKGYPKVTTGLFR